MHDIRELGIIIACYPGDLIWAKGCVGSLHRSGVRLPIQILFDGVASAFPELEALFARGLVAGITDRTSVKDPWLRANSFGWGFTKMIAFWESPWEHFIFLDADTAVSRDITGMFADATEADFLLDEPERPSDAAGVAKWFFEPSRVEFHYPDFSWRTYQAHYYCTGVFAARRGSIPLAEYQRALDIHRSDPAIYRFGGEMGMLNLLIFSLHQRGLATFRQRRLQLLTADHDDGFLQERLTEDRPWVFHYAGRKPLMHGDSFHEPMTSGRKWVADQLGGSLSREDLLFKIRYFLFRLRKKIRRLMGKRV